MGYVPTGFWVGGLLGRLLLAEPTSRLGERRMVTNYCILCIVLQLIFWLVPSIVVDAVMLSLLGFFSGPFFPTVGPSLFEFQWLISSPKAVSVGSKLFPSHLHSAALSMCINWTLRDRKLTKSGLMFVLFQAGGAIFPSVTGILAAHVGVKVLQPVLVGLFVATLVSWLLVPKVPKPRD